MNNIKSFKYRHCETSNYTSLRADLIGVATWNSINIYLFFIFSFILVSITLEAKVINGVDIPEEFIAKIEKYRCNYHQDCSSGGRGWCDFWIKELDFLLKKKIKYDATYYCKICRVFFPISSSWKTNVSNSEILCLDGFPENIDFKLPPECPYCGCMYPYRELTFEDAIMYEGASFRAHFDQIITDLPNPCERYLFMLDDTLATATTDYEKSQIYFKYACSPNAVEAKDSLEKSLKYFDKFLEKERNGKNIDSIFEEEGFRSEFAFFKLELLRQTGNFEKALECVSKLEKIEWVNDYILEFEKELIAKKNTKRALEPFGNKIHLAIKNGKSLAKINIPKDEKIRLAKEHNVHWHNGFIQAVYEENYSAINYLGKADKSFLEDVDYYKNTALHIASKLGNLDLVVLLLNLGADMEAKNIVRQTPICLAIRYGNLSVFNYLLKKGASLNLIDVEKNSPIQIACIGKNKNTLKMLSKLIDIEKKKDNFKESIQKCYRVTSWWGSPETYNLLKQTGVKDLTDITKIEGKNILELVKENGAEKILYENYLNALNCNNEKEIEAFKKTDLYDIFMKRYEEEHGKLKTEN